VVHRSCKLTDGLMHIGHGVPYVLAHHLPFPAGNSAADKPTHVLLSQQ
jgi:hypothetical protein